jgi:hypothetical protein
VGVAVSCVAGNGVNHQLCPFLPYCVLILVVFHCTLAVTGLQWESQSSVQGWACKHLCE